MFIDASLGHYQRLVRECSENRPRRPVPNVLILSRNSNPKRPFRNHLISEGSWNTAIPLSSPPSWDTLPHPASHTLVFGAAQRPRIPNNQCTPLSDAHHRQR